MARTSIMKACVLLSALVLLAASADAASSGRALLKGGPTTSGGGPTTGGTVTTSTAAPVPSPPPPKAAAATTGPATTTVAAPAPPPAAAATTTTTSSGKWNPLVSMAGDKCVEPKNGVPVLVNGYPSSPFPTGPLVFTKPYRPLQELTNSIKTKNGDMPCDEFNRCMNGFEIDIRQRFYDFGLKDPSNNCTQVPVLSYHDYGVPGPIMYSQTGVQDVVRFTNNIEDNNRYFPRGGPGNRGGDGEKDLCGNRLNRYQQRNSTGKIDEVTKPGRGRATVIHFHGEASVPSMDGWAEQYFCQNETKDYVLPNNRHATLFYHDHSVGITSENVYAGMAGMRIVRPCPSDDPYKVEKGPNGPGIKEWPMVIQDAVVDTPHAGDPAGVCRLKYDRLGVHQNQLWGDINLVNGSPWPYMNMAAGWNRFRFLNASPSRPRILTFRDDAGVEIGSKYCNIIGSDGGTVPYARQHPMPSTGLMLEVAYRWDIVCDWSNFDKKSVYLMNEHQPDRTTSETPYFCYSHLLAKLNIGAIADTNEGQKPDLDALRTAGTDQQDAQLPPDYYDQLVTRALGGESDRSLKFGRGEGMWLFNGRGWDKNDNLGKGKHIEFDDVGQNTVELWTLEAGGGWVHPVHIHLVDFFCVAWQGADWDGKALADNSTGWKPCPSELRYASKDVMHIGANVGRITLAARWGPNLGEYMMHCHNNVHEDDDMFRAFMIRGAEGSLTISKTPKFEVAALEKAPFSFYDQYGDDRNTTYSTEDGGTVAAPKFDTKYARELLGRRYYEIFYPQNGSVLTNSSVNMWLTTCGTHSYNAADDDGFVTPLASPLASPPPADASASSGSTSGGARRLLQRSDKHW